MADGALEFIDAPGLTEIDLLGFASVLGASACTKLGCPNGVFDRHEAERFLAGCSLVD